MTTCKLIGLFMLIAIAARAVAPSNNDFSARTTLGSVANFTINSTNIEATMEAGEPTLGGIAGSSVWYEWIAPSTGWVSLTTVGSDFDTVIGVFTGSAVNALTQVGFNDESFDLTELGTGHTSRLQLKTVSGTSYKIMVSGWTKSAASAQGTFNLVLSPLAPAFSVSALTLTPDPATITNAAASMTLQLTVGTSVPGPVSFSVVLRSSADATRFISLDLADAQRTSGTAASGTYQLAFPLPRYLPAGNWLATVIGSDGQRDTEWSFGSDNTEDDFVLPSGTDPVLSVVNTGLIDSAPPVLTAFTASPTTVNAGSVAQAGRVLTLNLSVTDNLAGYQTGTVTLVGDNDEEIVATVTSTQLISGGDALDGDYTVSAVVPYGLNAGTYAFRVILQDAALNSRTYSSEAGATFGLPSGSTPTIAVTGTGGYPEWARAQFFVNGQFDPLQDADHDGTSNLAEYAFNLEPTGYDSRPVVTNTGTSGLPLVTRVSGTLRIEFLRRKASTNSGLTYTPQFCDSLQATGTGGWANATATPTVTSIDSTWERVFINDTVTGTARRFGRVKLTYAQP